MSLQLYLIRHAKSSWDFPELDDYERPLNDRGLKNAPEVGKHLVGLSIKPDLLISSPAKRAIDTCKLIAKEFKYPEAQIKTDNLIYHASVIELYQVLRQLNDKYKTVFLFGHNPGLSDFGNSLSGEYFEDIPTCGVLGLEIQEEKWAETKKGSAKVSLFEYPKRLGY
jgi:phosphohistidine phosphatase